jgi:hypothetical protein
MRILATKEAHMHEQLAKVLDQAGIDFEREKQVGKTERFDLWLPAHGIVIEVKMWISVGALRRQIKRYADSAAVQAVLVAARKPMTLPATLSGKPVVCLNLWRAQI